jgi:hypothetical protein
LAQEYVCVLPVDGLVRSLIANADVSSATVRRETRTKLSAELTI